MAEVKWIKLVTEFFDDEKIKLIESMPEADMVLIIWVKLLTLAGKKNMNGYIFLTENIPYTEEMLSTIFNRPVNTIRLALETFKNFNMIEYNGNGQIKIANWEKHQNIEALEKLKEGNRKRANDYRQRLISVGGYSYLEHYKEVYERDNGKCVYCSSENDLCLDHLIPLMKGGDNELDNLVLACKPCNSGKSGRFIEDAKYNFVNEKTKNQYEKTKKRLKITHNVTLHHATDKIRVDKIENKDINKVQINDFQNLIKNPINNPKEKKKPNNIEFDFEMWSWHGIDDDIQDRWGKIFPHVEIEIELNKMRDFFKLHPNHEKVIMDKFNNNYAIYIFDWLTRSEKWKIEDSRKSC